MVLYAPWSQLAAGFEQGPSGVPGRTPLRPSPKRQALSRSCPMSDDFHREPAVIELALAHEARVEGFLLGGEACFGTDREVAARTAEALGGIGAAHGLLGAGQAFLGEAVGFLAEHDVDQVLDIGCGLPVDGCSHEVLDRELPGARVVHVDNDPIVLAHAHRLKGETSCFVEGDLRRPEDILFCAAEMLDLSEPVGVFLGAVLHFLNDEDRPFEVVARLMEPLVSGSSLAVSHLTADVLSDRAARLVAAPGSQARYEFHPRTQAAVAGFFDGLDLVAPGVVPLDRWLIDQASGEGEPVVGLYCGGIGRKP